MSTGSEEGDPLRADRLARRLRRVSLAVRGRGLGEEGKMAVRDEDHISFNLSLSAWARPIDVDTHTSSPPPTYPNGPPPNVLHSQSSPGARTRGSRFA